MTDSKNDTTKTLEFLVYKSRDLLQEQLKSYESANSKAGVLISISALLIPIAVTFISSSNTILVIKYLTILPTVLMIFALIFLLKVLMPKGLDHGFNFEQFENQLDVGYENLLLYEIGSNKSSYSGNEPKVNSQNKNFKTGVKLIFSSAILILLLVTSSLFVTNNNSEPITKERKTNNIYNSNNLNQYPMSDNNSNTDSNSNQNQQQSQNSQESTRIPYVPSEERASIQKSEEQTPLTKGQ